MKRSAQVNINNIKFDNKDITSFKQNIEELTKSFNNQKKNVDDLKNRYDKLVEAGKENSDEARKIRIEYNKQADELNKLGTVLNNAKNDLAELEKAQGQSISKWQKHGRALDDIKTKLQNVGSQMKETGAQITAGLSVPLAGLAGVSTASALSMEQSQTRLQNSLALTEKEASKLTQTAREIYKDGFGDSIDEVDEAIIQVKQNIKGLNDEDLAEVTKSSLTLAKTFNTDVNEVTRASQGLMKGFGLEATDAFDLMAYGAQNGLNFSNEMFDNLSEYAPLFGKMGYSAEEYFDLLVKGSEAGVYNLDYINDVMKEFQIRIKDNSKSTTDAMGMLSTETQGVWKEFMNGNGTVKDVSNTVLAELQGMEDQVKANEIGVGLFGTKWEDLESEAMYALGGIDGGVKTAGGSMDKMNETLEDSPMFRLSGLWREMKAALSPLGMVFLDLAERVLPTFQNILSTITETIQGLSPKGQLLSIIIGALGAAIGPVVVAGGVFVSALSKIFGAVSKVMTSIDDKGGLKKGLKLLGGRLSFLAGPIGIAIGVITTLVSAFGFAYTKSETFRTAINNLITRFKNFFSTVGEVKDGIVALFAGEWTSGKGILSKVGLDDEHISKLQQGVETVKSKFQDVKNSLSEAFTAMKGYAKDLFSRIKEFWKSDGEQTFTAIKNVVSTTISVVKGILSVAMPIISTIVNVAFKLILTVAKMVWGNLKGVIDGALKLIMGIVRVFTGIFTGDFSKMWQGVKDIFSGAIQIVWNGFQLLFYGRIIKGVAGLVKTFAGSIKSLWTKVVEFFKGMYTGASNQVTAMKDKIVQLIKNLNTSVNNTVSKMVSSVFNFFRNLLTNSTKTVNNLYLKVWNLFKTLQIKVSSTVSNLVSKVTNFFKSLQQKVSSIVTSLGQKVWNLFKTLQIRVQTTVSNLYNKVYDLFSRLKSKVVSVVSALFQSAKNIFLNLQKSLGNITSNLRSNVVNLFSRMGSSVMSGVRTLKSNVASLFTNIKDDAIKIFDKLVEGAKKIPGRLRDAIVAGKDKAKKGIQNLGNTMLDTLESLINKLVNGMNNVLDKLGLGSSVIDTVNIPQFSTGTGKNGGLVRNGAIAKDTFATVGDKGMGNGKGTRELVQFPNGKTGLFDNDATIFAPKGTVIYNNKQTENILSGTMPKFSTGSGAKGKSGEKKKGLLGTFKDLLSNTWDYIKNPKKAFDAIVDNVGAKFDGLKGFGMEAAKGGFTFVKDKAFDWIKNIFKENENSLGSGAAQSFMKYRMTTPYSPNKAVPGYPTSFNGGKHFGIDYGTPMGAPIHATLGGKVTKLNNNGGGLVAKLQSGEITQFFMHLSEVLKTGSVKKGDLIAKSGNSGQWTTGPHVHWQAQKGSQVMNANTIDPLKVIKGHANGGLIEREGMYRLGEGNNEEMVIPLTKPKEAQKLIALTAKKLSGKSKQTSELPNVGNIFGGGNQQVEDKLDNVIDILSLLLISSQNIEDKELILNIRDVLNGTRKHNDKRSIIIP